MRCKPALSTRGSCTYTVVFTQKHTKRFTTGPFRSWFETSLVLFVFSDVFRYRRRRGGAAPSLLGAGPTRIASLALQKPECLYTNPKH